MRVLSRVVTDANLFHVTLEDREQFPQFLPAFRRVLSAFDAMMGVRMNQFFGERFQAATGGDDLREDFRAVAIFVQHPFHRVELADDFAHPDNRGAALLFGMVMMVFGHAQSVRAAGSFVKKRLANKGYGGMILLL